MIEPDTSIEKYVREIEDINNNLERLVHVTNEIIACSHVEEFIPKILEEFSHILAAEGGSVYLLKNERLVLCHSLDPEHATPSIELPLCKESVFGRVIESGRPVLIADITDETELNPSGWTDYKNHSLVTFPLLEGTGNVIGIVTFHNKSIPPFTYQDQRLGTILSSFISKALCECRMRRERLIDSERFRTLFEQSNDAIFIYTLEGEILDLNNRVCDMLGYTKEYFLSSSIESLLPEGLTHKTVHPLRLMAERSACVFESQFKKVDGTIIDVEISARIVDKDNGLVQGIVRNLSEKKESAIDLRKSKERYSAMFDHINDAVAVYRPENDGRNFIFVEFNKAGEKAEQIEKEHVIGKRVTEIFPGVIEFGLFDVFQRVHRTGVSEAYPMTFYYDERIAGWRDNFVYRLPTGEIVAIYRDVTQEKQAEETLRSSEERMRSIVASMPVMLDAFDDEGTLIVWNRECERVTGYAKEEMIGDPDAMKRLYPNENYRDWVYSTVREQNGDFRNLELALTCRDGSKRIISWSNISKETPIEGWVTWAIGVDITGRIQAEKKAIEVLQTSDDIVNAIPSGLLIYQFQPPDRLFLLSGNPESKQVTGIDAREWHGKEFNEIWPNARKQGLTNAFLTVMKTGKPYETEDLFFKDKRLEKAFKARAFRISGDKLAVALENITECRKAEIALQESEQLYRSAIEVAGAVPYYQNYAKGIYEFVSPGIKDLTGYSPNEFTYEVWQSLEKEIILFGELRGMSNEGAVAKAKEGEGISWRADYRIQTRSGEERWVANAAVQVRDEKGNIVGSLGILQDITERKNIETALRESNEMIRAFVETSKDWIWSMDLNGTHTYCNPAIETILGYSPDELVGKSCFESIHPKDWQTLEEKWYLWIQNKSGWSNLLIRWHHKNGTWRYLESNAVPVLDEKGGLTGFRGIDRDVTERKQMEDELLKARKLESIGILAGGIAHDFNNLLTAILGNVSLAKAFSDPDDRVFERLTEAENASFRARDLTQQLLTFSKGGAPIKETADIRILIRETVSFVLRGSKTVFNIHCSDDLWLVEVDKGQFSQVIQNLAINANQAMPNGGTIDIHVDNCTLGDTPEESGIKLDSGNYVRIEFKDQGIGISDEYLPKIFDPYFTTKQKGSGLGLATVYSIVKNHGGSITVRSKLDSGTTFLIYLPASPDQRTTDSIKERTTLTGGHGRILLMDDEQLVRDVLSQMLVQLGYETDTARDGSEAIAKYENAIYTNTPYHAVIMDLTIPGGVGGKDAIERLTQIDPDIKAIVSSGYSNDPIMADFRKYGFSGVIGKPYKMEELSKVLHEVLAKEI